MVEDYHEPEAFPSANTKSSAAALPKNAQVATTAKHNILKKLHMLFFPPIVG
jgi:hypothetical protein